MISVRHTATREAHAIRVYAVLARLSEAQLHRLADDAPYFETRDRAAQELLRRERLGSL